MHMTITDDFSALGLSEQMLAAVRAKGFETPTAIQKLTIPHLLTKPNDIIAQSQTGTGKTAAYGLPILQTLEPARGPIQAIILVPTRELALQAAEELLSYNREKRLSITAIYGGAAMSEQLRRLAKGIDIVVGTPGRVLDHIRRGTMKLENVRYLVLDEADEMLNMGFVEDVEEIMSHTSDERRVLLFSATMPERIIRLSKTYMRDTEIVRVEHTRKINTHQICRQLSRLPEICWSSMAFSSFVRKNCSAAGVLNALRTTPAYCSSRSQARTGTGKPSFFLSAVLAGMVFSAAPRIAILVWVAFTLHLVGI